MAVLRIVAGNPSLYTLDGTNTYIVGRDPAWVIDPGPDQPAHLDAVAAAVQRRGGAGGIALTHDHSDHSGGIEGLRARLAEPVPVACHPDGYRADQALADGDRCGPLQALHLPGHAPDHIVFIYGREGFTGDAVLGAGSVFVAADLGRYLDGLARLRALALTYLHPGHGPRIDDPARRLELYIEHRLERERQIAAALDTGISDNDELIAAVWGNSVPEELIPAVRWTIEAHREKLGR